MLSKLENTADRFEEIGLMLTQQEIVNDTAKYTALMKIQRA